MKKSKRLPKKLLRIRQSLGLSQNEIIKTLNLDGHKQQQISGYERGEYEPPIAALLEYARAVNVCLEVLVDDAYELPVELPAKSAYHPHHPH